jgi:histidinol phosphatase-like enzyme
MKRLRRTGFACVLVTNQSAIARGMVTEDRFDQIHTELHRQLAAAGATLDGTYYCPDAPGRRRSHGGGVPRPQIGTRYAAPRRGRPETGSGLIVDNWRFD